MQERYMLSDSYDHRAALAALDAAGFPTEQQNPLVVYVPAFDRSVVIGRHERRPDLRPVEAPSKRGAHQSVRAVATVLGSMVERY